MFFSGLGYISFHGLVQAGEYFQLAPLNRILQPFHKRALVRVLLCTQLSVLRRQNFRLLFFVQLQVAHSHLLLIFQAQQVIEDLFDGVRDDPYVVRQPSVLYCQLVVDARALHLVRLSSSRLFISKQRAAVTLQNLFHDRLYYVVVHVSLRCAEAEH